MQFLAYDPHYDPNSPEAAVPPSPELMAEMGLEEEGEEGEEEGDES